MLDCLHGGGILLRQEIMGITNLSIVDKVLRGRGLAMGDHILVVDDDPDAREILDLVLSTLSLPLQLAHDGREALDLIAAEPPLLIMLDLSMPEVDGETVLNALRSNPETADVPVIVFTARTVTPDLADQLHVPLSRIVRKGNLSMTQLRDIVKAILGRSVPVNVRLNL